MERIKENYKLRKQKIKKRMKVRSEVREVGKREEKE